MPMAFASCGADCGLSSKCRSFSRIGCNAVRARVGSSMMSRCWAAIRTTNLVCADRLNCPYVNVKPPARSILPPRRRRPRRLLPQPVLRHLPNAIRAGTGPAPAVRLLVPIDEDALVVRIFGRLHPRLHLADGALEEKAVHVADVDVQLVHQFRADRRPVALQV